MPIDYSWMSRALGVGQWDELWADPSAHPAYGDMTAWLRRWSREDEAKFYLTATLLTEVIAAAEAVRYAADSLRSALDETQERLDAYVATSGTPRPDTYSDIPVNRARIEFVNLVTWARALNDRLTDSLLPAMNPAHPATRAVERLVDKVEAGGLEDASWLANFGLHVSFWPYARAGLPVDAEGRVRFPVPDLLAKKLASPWLLTYEDAREARAFAGYLEQLVAKFMDDLLKVFEEATRTRWAPP